MNTKIGRNALCPLSARQSSLITPDTHPDLHLVLSWEWAQKEQKDFCLLKVYRYSEAEGLSEERESVNYYIGLENKARSLPKSYGTGRNFAADLDLSNLSAEKAAKVLCTPGRVFQEIEDKKAGKIDEDEHFQTSQFGGVGAGDPTGYMRDDDNWQAKEVARGADRSFEKSKVPQSKARFHNKRSTGSRGWYGDAELERPQPVNVRGKVLADNVPGGTTVKQIRVVSGPRKDAPWWILDAERFRDFANVLVLDKGGLFVALDYTILFEFYRLGYEDKEIFGDHQHEFSEETHRQRRTSSVAAVKMRRRRLVQYGNERYGVAQPNIIPISQPRPHAKPVKRAFGGLAGR